MIEKLLKRRSVRAYSGRPLEPGKLRAVLRAGACAPSAHDSRPWRFAVFSSPASRERLCSELERALERDLRQAGAPDILIQSKLSRSARIFGGAQALICLLARRTDAVNPLDGTGGIEQHLSVQSAVLAGGQMLLAAHALGLGACWFAAPLFCPETVCRACGLERELWLPQALLTLGYPAGEPGKKPEPRPEDCTVFL